MLASKFSKVFSGCYAGGSCFHKHFRNKETRTFCLSFCFNTVILVFFCFIFRWPQGEVPWDIEDGVFKNGTGAFTIESHFFESLVDTMFEKRG